VRVPVPVLTDLSWQEYAACARIGGDHWFAEKGSGTTTEARAARRACTRCPVRLECLTTALINGEVGGLWGGLTEKERRNWALDDDGHLYERSAAA